VDGDRSGPQVTFVVATVAHEVTSVGFQMSRPLPWRDAAADEGDVLH
jgi:hypothetical protein